MKKTLFATLFFGLMGLTTSAQYVSPNTGATIRLADIAAESPSTVTGAGEDFQMLQEISISESDTLIIDSNLTLAIAEDLRLTVFGTFLVTAESTTFTAIDEEAPYDGFRFEEGAVVNIQNAKIQYGGGLRVINDDFTINNSELSYNVSGVSTGSVISLSRGTPQITNNTFKFNELPAVSSAANRQVSAYIFNNYMEGNNLSNSNRPQINMGTTMATDTLKIIQNTIIGDPELTRVGGIAVSNLTGGQVLAVIDGNTIQGNRYGITVVGANTFAYIRDNIIEDNNTEGNPAVGGSGISLSTNSGPYEVIASGNEIRRNLWGITVINEARVNLGDDDTNPGQNVFSDNGNNGTVTALYNNTSSDILAKNNCWIEGEESTEEEVEDVIFHFVDDATLGEVIFDPFLCGVLSVEGHAFEDFAVYPNPVKDYLHFENKGFTHLTIYSVDGKKVYATSLSMEDKGLAINLPKGIYLAQFSNASTTITKKISVK